ncbi:DUF1707 domain-containing protein [Nocardia sp. NPDC051832]|uniref:DUF1707 SHOCT-like domain-containing protein n=1 Tax=Nocardia sp. NPDC051832 TaxID=3155673 RepID=UPI003422E8C8
MHDDPDTRISTAQREQALRELVRHLGTGRLDLDEFDRRCARATTATTGPQLAELFTDLPASEPDAPPERTAGALPVFLGASGCWLVVIASVAATSGEVRWLLLVLLLPGILLLVARGR